MVSYWGVLTVVVLLASGVQSSGSSRKTAVNNNGAASVRGNVPVGADIKASVNFDCPEEFGYYPHPNDCTQYYVCVFGGALLESCTGGLMYSHELQTCDWPRNVGCDGLSEVEVEAPVSSSSSRERVPESRSRYTPPPPPAQPAAVVTSRGQPRERQLHHNQQDILKQKQQQQLYAEAEETLPIAEEIESDRQQRVYRGQPSTVGQVQRDRDGLRHTNAIPSYGGRNEKIGVISFGTGQQSLQQYSIVTNVPDILTNDLTLKRSKRQLQQQRQQQLSQRSQQLTTSIPLRAVTSRPNHTTPKTPLHVSSSDITPSGSETQTSRAPPQHKTERIHKRTTVNPTTTEHSVYTHKFPRHHFQFSWPIDEAEEELSSKSPTHLKQSVTEKQEDDPEFTFEESPPPKKTSTPVPLYEEYSSAETQSETKAPADFNEELLLNLEISTTERYKEPKSPFYDFFHSDAPGATTPQPKQEQKQKKAFDVSEEEEDPEESNTKKSVSDGKKLFVDIPNPFADPNFDFNGYLQVLQSRPSPVQQLQPQQPQQQQQGTISEAKMQKGILHPNQAIPQKVFRPYKPYTIVAVKETSTPSPVTTLSPFNDYAITYVPHPALPPIVRTALKDLHSPRENYEHTVLNPFQTKSPTAKSSGYPTYKSNERGPQTFSHILPYNKPGYKPGQNANQKAPPKVQVKHVPVVATDDYYYYYYEDEPKPKQSQQQLNKASSNNNKVEVANKKPEDDEYYYYEYYDDPDEKNKTTKNNAAPIRYDYLFSPHPNYKATSRNPYSNPNSFHSQSHNSYKPPTDFYTLKPTNTPLTTTPYSIYIPNHKLIYTTVKPVTTTVQSTTSNKRQRLTTTDGDPRRNKPKFYNRVEESSVAPAQQQSVSTATARTLYNSSRYEPNRYDPYYALYDDDAELYRDVDYHQQYNTNSAQQSQQQQQSPQQTYRGTPAPVAPASVETPKRGSTRDYIQNNNYSPQDVYQQSTLSDYNDDNNYNTQVDEQNSYRSSSKQPSRGDRNELSYVEEPASPPKRITTTSTKKTTTTTTTTSPRPIPTQKSTVPTSRSPDTATANQTRAQSIFNTLSEDPGHPTTPLTDIKQTTTELYTYRTKDVNPEFSLHVPIRAAVSQPAPFTLPKHLITTSTETPLQYHYITKTNDVVTTTTTTTTIDEALMKKAIIPTTYSPPKFFLKSLLYLTNNASSTETPVHVVNKPYKTLKSVRKLVSPEAEADETVVHDTNKEVDFSELVQPNPYRHSTLVRNKPNINKQITISSSSSTTTTKPTETVQATQATVPKSSTYEIDQEYVHDRLLSRYTTEGIQKPEKRFRNTVEVPPPDQLLYNPEDLPKAERDELPSYKPPKPDVTTKTVADISRNMTRTSRVNAAIKSQIAFGGTRRPNTKCNDTTSYANCNDLKQRASTRGRGSAHYSSSSSGSGAIGNSDTATVNRGTPPTRSRPTLKPSTSIVSKASEFIDIYKHLPSRPDAIYPQPQPDKTAAKCRKDVCLLPDCSCGGKEIPGDLPVEQVPQIVLLTFDDSVNDLNKGLYHDLFEKGRVNPNGCPIAATFYVSHEWTDYSQVQNLYSDGHEIASHTVSHSFGEQFSQKKWTREVAGQREILAAYGGVHLDDVRGMRAPFLSVGGNKMFKMLYDSNFTYDSSMPIYENKPPSWPYTLDYKLFHDCMIPPCPTRSYPGVWEVPMVMWQDLNGGRCSMGDACSNPPDAEGVMKMLMKNFERHYTTNRAPFGLFYHAAWFTQPHHKEGFIQFLDTINQMKDVWLVTNWQAIQWVREPTPISRLNSFKPFQCDYSDRPKRCNNPKVCNLWHKSGVRYMRTCQPCPDIYPWTGNTGIRSSRIDNDIED